jgi:ABC-type glutathione transport system ATPase component
LTKQAHTKAAEAVKKAAKDVVALKDGPIVEEASLDEIVRRWKTMSTSS